jgi:mannose-1-phosphate guanylyltransferase
VIEAGAIVEGSVICDGARIGAGAEVRNSIVGYGATIAGAGDDVRGAVLDGVVIGDEAFIGPGNELLKGARVWPGTRLDATAVRFSTDA